MAKHRLDSEDWHRENTSAVCQSPLCFWTASGPMADKAARAHVEETGHTVMVVYSEIIEPKPKPKRRRFRGKRKPGDVVPS